MFLVLNYDWTRNRTLSLKTLRSLDFESVSCCLQTVNQLSWFHWWLGSHSAPDAGSGLDIETNDLLSMVLSHDSNILSLPSSPSNKLHLLHTSFITTKGGRHTELKLLLIFYAHVLSLVYLVYFNDMWYMILCCPVNHFVKWIWKTTSSIKIIIIGESRTEKCCF